MLLLNPVIGQQVDLSGWKPIPVPVNDSLQSIIINSDNHWTIVSEKKHAIIVPYHHNTITGDSLLLSRQVKQEIYRSLPGNKIIHKVADGYLIFTNNGEYGGGTWLLSTDGKKRTKIDDHKVVNLFSDNHVLYALQTTGGIPEGSIIEVYKDSSWHTKTVHQFVHDVPLVAQKVNNEVFIVCYNSLVRFTKDKQVIPILTPPYLWGRFYPTSIAISGENVCIGMRHGIQKIKNYTTTPEYEWYIPDPK